jgi:hypothetical protein
MDDTTQPMTAQPAAPAVPGPGTAAQPIDPPPALPVQPPLASRLLRLVLVAAGGLGLLLVGLVVDAVLHARDPGLAGQEGVFAPSNPGHLLVGIGIALVSVGLAGALATLVLAARGPRALARPARLGLAGGALGLAVVAGGAGVWAAGAGGQGEHAPAAHVHTAGAAEVANPGADGPDGAGTPGHAHGPNLPDLAAADAGQRARAQALWKASVANAERWRDPEAAASAGFRFRDDGGAPGPERRIRFLHVPNPAWRADGRTLDPARPETLVYWRGPQDRLVLVGVMYTAPRGTRGPAVGGPITRWHDHESCRDPATRAKLSRPVDGACPEGQVFRRSGEMMHVWFTGDLASAFARRAPLAALRTAAGGAMDPTP